MTRIFVSYRRDDSAGFAGRLTDALEARFGAGTVFRDVDDIRPGEDFVRSLESAIGTCVVLIAVIGRQWLAATDSTGRRRLEDPRDYVRLEIASALRRRMEVIPVLVEGAPMPAPADLPQPLAALSRRQAVVLGDGTWSTDLERLFQALEPHIKTDEAQQPRAGGDPSRLRRLFIGAIAGVAATAVAIGGWVFLRHPTDLTGVWTLPDGNVWMVRLSGRDLQIEEVHHESNEVWRAGTARQLDRALEVDMHYVFSPETKLRGKLEVAPDGRSLSGTLVETPGGRRLGVLLRR